MGEDAGEHGVCEDGGHFRERQSIHSVQNGALVPGRDRRNSLSTVRFAGRPTSEGCSGKASFNGCA